MCGTARTRDLGPDNRKPTLLRHVMQGEAGDKLPSCWTDLQARLVAQDMKCCAIVRRVQPKAPNKTQPDHCTPSRACACVACHPAASRQSRPATGYARYAQKPKPNLIRPFGHHRYAVRRAHAYEGMPLDPAAPMGSGFGRGRLCEAATGGTGPFDRGRGESTRAVWVAHTVMGFLLRRDQI
jgi:hypothetical protein